MRLLCVYTNRKMAVVLTNFSAMFPFVTCVKESENQPNGFVESHRQPKSISEAQGLNKRLELDLIIWFYQLSYNVNWPP